MSLNAWKQLEELEKFIHDHFDNADCGKKGCPSSPRVHIVYAHYAARPDVAKNVSDAWVFPTLGRYDDCKAQDKPRSTSAAMDFLGGHFLWVRAPNVEFAGLPAPPLETAIEPTLEKDGGTLIHFSTTEFPKLTPTAEQVKAKQTPTRAITVTTPVFIDDTTFIEQYNETALSQNHSRTAKDANGVTIAEIGPPVATASTLPPPPPAEPVERGASYPLYRRLCLSRAGQEGDHKRVNPDGATRITASFPYRDETSHAVLRLFSISPAFNFETRGTKAAATPDPPVYGPPAPAGSVLTDDGDPWARSTRDPTLHHNLWETTSNTWVGSITTSKYGNGLAKPVNARPHPGPALTTTKDLGKRFAAELGKSRGLVFQAVWNVEGPCEAVQTYDAGMLSWGINQWTAAGELQQLVAYIYDFFPNAFARRFAYYGIGVWFSSRSVNWTESAIVYKDVFLYRVPCCGPKVRTAMKAVLEDWAKAEAAAKAAADKKAADAQKKAAAAAKAKKLPPPAPEPPTPEPPEPEDLPPQRMKYLAKALQLSKPADYVSFAACYIFTTAGTDPEIQKAMAQWMSYRITAIHPAGKPIRDVIRQFLNSLRPAKAELDKRVVTASESLEQDVTPEAKREAETKVDDKDIQALETKLADAKANAALKAGKDTKAPKSTKPKIDPQVAVAEKELADAKTKRKKAVEAATKVLVDEKVNALLDQTFSDDDADEAWIRWPTRCADAGKTTTGKLIEQETAPKPAAIKK